MEDTVIKGPRSKAVLTCHFSINNCKNSQLLSGSQIPSLRNCRSVKLFIFLIGKLIAKMYKEIEIVKYFLELQKYLAGQ